MRTIEEIMQIWNDARSIKSEPGTIVPVPLTMEEIDLLNQTITTRNIDTMIEAGDLQGAAVEIDLAGNFQHRSQRLLLQYADRFTDPQMLFDLIVSVYINDGYNFPKRLIQKAKQIARQIPAEHRLKGLPAGDTVTIWRGTYVANPNCGKFLRTDISWTTDKTMAIWFANRIPNPNTPNGKGAVWEGTIARDKIIAFTQNRNESEVIQHMNVKAPHILDISPEEWEAALQHQQAERERHMDEFMEGGQHEPDT